MKNIYTRYGCVLLLLLGLIIGSDAKAQTTYFEQNFNGTGPFTAGSPNSGQFNTITANGSSSFSTAAGNLSMTRDTTITPSSVSVIRSTPFSPVPSTMYLEVDVSVPNVISPYNGAAVFSIGTALSSLTPNNNTVFARFSINLGVNNTFQIRNTPGAATGITVNSTIFANTSTVKVIVVMNNRTTSTTYFDPRNATAPQIVLAPGTYDIWVDNVALVLGRGKVSGTSASPTLSTFNFLFFNGRGNIVLDNLRIRDISGVLPVNLTYFNAQATGGQVGLAWETAWEQNSKEFLVQRSTDLKEFGDIGTVAAMGQTEGRQAYRFTDPSPALGTNYYRLRMVDEDGSYEYSKVKDVINRPNEPVLLVSPNPVSNQTIRLRTFMLENSTLKLSTILGQDIPFRTNEVGNNTVELVPTSTLSPGIYIISAQRDGIRVHSQLIVP